ncbi:MAG: hypothetical protein ACPLXM_06570 [Bacteroidales bacterium]
MDQDENIYGRITEILGHKPQNFSILEEQIDLDVQMEYFEFSRNMNHSNDVLALPEKKELLYNPAADKSVKKEILARLAFSDEIEAFRLLQAYVRHGDEELRDWAILAMQECRVLIESKLLDENQIFISTGLGGKGFKLRYFIVLLLRPNKRMTPLREKIILNETEAIFKKHTIDTESVRFAGRFVTLLVMIPLDITIRSVFDEIISVCNYYGNFLQEDFVVTNVRILTDSEIKKFNRKKITPVNRD